MVLLLKCFQKQMQNPKRKLLKSVILTNCKLNSPLGIILKCGSLKKVDWMKCLAQFIHFFEGVRNGNSHMDIRYLNVWQIHFPNRNKFRKRTKASHFNRVTNSLWFMNGFICFIHFAFIIIIITSISYATCEQQTV